MRSLLFLVLFFSGFLFAEENFTFGDIPATPSDGVYDPNQWLTEDSRAEMVRNIKKAKLEWNAEIYAVILTDTPELDMAVLAQEAAESWGEAKLWGVVFHVIGAPNSPRFYSGRKESFGWGEEQEGNFSDSLARALSEVKRRAMREDGQRLQVQTGVREFCDELGYLGLVMSRIDKRYDRARGENLTVVRKQRTTQKFLQKFLLVLIPLIICVIAVLIYLFRKKHGEAKFCYLFPETSPRRRFMAPWSGGADVIVSVGPRLRPDGSRKG